MQVDKKQMTFENEASYLAYLAFLNEKFDKFFASQSPYIFCKEGCAKCCKDAQFPYSEVEAKILLNGFCLLAPEIQQIIRKNIAEVKAKKKEFKGEKFLYTCPFLIDNSCAVYNSRGIVCRAFGLMYVGKNERTKVPFCCNMGLNYSNVYDIETATISEEMFKNLGTEVEPYAFNVDYDFLTDEVIENGFHVKFGEKKPLIDWL